jgi:hypothetical protein
MLKTTRPGIRHYAIPINFVIGFSYDGSISTTNARYLVL